jgi:hypothetical protein
MYLGTRSLVAKSSLQSAEYNWNGVGKSWPFFGSAPLPNDQWITEVKHWFEIMLVKLQLTTLRYATGPANEASSLFVTPPEKLPDTHDLRDTHADEYLQFMRHMCSQQRMIFANSTKLSFTGLIIVVVVGVIIVIIGQSIEPIVASCRRVFHTGQHEAEEWKLDGIWHLQRMAFEAANRGRPWIRTEKDVPLPAKDTTFTLSDKEMTRICYNGTPKQEGDGGHMQW